MKKRVETCRKQGAILFFQDKRIVSYAHEYVEKTKPKDNKNSMAFF